MEPRLARRRVGSRPRRWSEEFRPAAQPLVRPVPRATMFFPVVVLVAVLPGLYALRSWDLNPPGPWWGLRGLTVLEGRWLDQVPAAGSMGPEAEARTFRAVALQPPLYAWLEAVGLALSERAPVATILPSYAAGVLVVVLVYLHGRLWQGPGPGLAAAVLMGFNRDLLLQMQQATPTTLGLAGALGALLCYGQHLRAGDGRRLGWAVLGGLGLGVSLLAVGAFGLLTIPVVLLHQGALPPEPAPARRPMRGWRGVRLSPSLAAGALALALGLALAAPWHVLMFGRYGRSFAAALLAPAYFMWSGHVGLLARLIDLAPAVVPLGLFAAARAVRRALVAETDDPMTVGGAFWVVWLGAAALALAVFSGGPRPALNLFLLVPLNLLAAQAIADLAGRRIKARALTWLAPATACTVAWRYSTELQGAVFQLSQVFQGGRVSSGTALGLHLGLDLVLVLALATRGLDRWARRRDDRRRLVLGGFLGAVAAVTVASGISEVRFRHRETADLLALRQAILRRQQHRPFRLLAVVGPDPQSLARLPIPPGGRLRFILRATLPHLAQLELGQADDLLNLPYISPRLVILTGTRQRLSYAVQSRLRLEAIHPGRSGVFEAFATALETSESPARR
ncbi:MAG: glycosyltransferase family 39 protein [Isosphaeraceae bacterium]|nr:glycosyltransferase family 39 protein [Isosphaeraceae bacterium]